MGAEKTVLENGDLLVEINRFGAELARIYDKTHQREVLWEGKPEIWGRHAPILFPFVGKCYEDRYYYEGKAYPMTSHGFARDMEFTLVSQTEEEVWYRAGKYGRNPEEISLFLLSPGRHPFGGEPDPCDVEGEKSGGEDYVFYAGRSSGL